MPKSYRYNCGPDVLVVLDSRGSIHVFEESFACSELRFRKRDRFSLMTFPATNPEHPLSYGISWTYVTRSLSVQTRAAIANRCKRSRQNLLADVFLRGCEHDVTKSESFYDFGWNNQILVGYAGGYSQAWLFTHRLPTTLNEAPLRIEEMNLSQPSRDLVAVTALRADHAVFIYSCVSGIVAREASSFV